MINKNGIHNTYFRSLPKLSSQDEEGGAGIGFPATPAHFEPIPHDHDFCERVVINVCILCLVFSSLVLLFLFTKRDLI